MQPQPYEHRIHTLQKQLQPRQAFLITQPADLTYLTGFQPVTHNEREGLLLVTLGNAELFAAAFSPLPLYVEEAVVTGRTLPFLKVYRTTNFTKIALSISQAKVDELILDETGIFLAESRQLQIQLEAIAVDQTTPPSFTPLQRQSIWKQRTIKDEGEVKLIRKAAQIANKALAEILQTLQEDQTEKEIAHRFETKLRLLGADGPAFPTIVAFGEHATLPHHQPGDTKLTKETPVLIDCGAAVSGYNSDMTRTVWFGEHPSAEFLKVKTVVDQAYQLGLETLQQRTLEKKDLAARDIDTAVRHFITDAGYGNEFIHTTGHGIGIEVHEPPSIYQTNPELIEDNMVITIEPGIYLPKLLGYRYENTVLVTSKAPEELTK
ncbi:M24 family metallopeptidase [Patescibacteria group bacterium]|nr:M24 family metallopeptidase [Patescibacteria group bacterium]